MVFSLRCQGSDSFVHVSQVYRFIPIPKTYSEPEAELFTAALLSQR